MFEGSLSEAISSAMDDEAISLPIETERELREAIEALPLVMLDAAVRMIGTREGHVPVLVLQTMASQWRSLAERHKDGGPGEGTAADTWAEAARELALVIDRHKPEADPRAYAKAGGDPGPFTLTSPEVPEIDPRIRQAYLETIAGHPAPGYPRQEGDTIVLGPEVFASADRAVISWQGRNYIPQDQYPLIRSTDGHEHRLGLLGHTRWVAHDQHPPHRHSPDGRTIWQNEATTAALPADTADLPGTGPLPPFARGVTTSSATGPLPGPGLPAYPSATMPPGAASPAGVIPDPGSGDPAVDQPRLIPISVQMVVEALLERVQSLEAGRASAMGDPDTPAIEMRVLELLAEEFRELARLLENAEVLPT